MRIAIDARWIFAEISGIGTYTRELIRQLARLDTQNEYVLLFREPALRDRTAAEVNLARAGNFATHLVPYGLFSLRNQLFLPRRLAALRADVFHSPNYMIPLLAFGRRRRRTACVVTIHDVIPMIFRDQVARSKKARIYPLYRCLMLAVGRRADAIITVSQASAADVIEHLRLSGAAAAKVRAIYNGVSEQFRTGPAGAGARPLRAADNRPRTLLFVGRCDPYKNLHVLVRALALVRQQCPFPVTLTVAGAPDPRYPEARQTAAALGLAPAVNWTGYLTDAALRALYGQADLLVHPSRYEGFGLQVAEAMACGLPVVCGNAGALREIAGDAALLVDPDDVAGLAAAIGRVLADPRLARDMSAKGIRQAAQFTWDRTARATLEVYENVSLNPKSKIQNPKSQP